MHDPVIRRELLAVIIGKSTDSIKRDIRSKKLPGFDAAPNRKIQGWRLSTLAAWNPKVGRQIDGLLKSPYLPAA